MISGVVNCVRRLQDFNWRASWILSRHSQSRGRFQCRGRIQLRVGKDAKINGPENVSYIGISLRGASLTLNRTTVVSLEEKATLSLDGAIIGRGSVVAVGRNSQFTMGEKSYLNDNSQILAGSSEGITIGRECAISFGVTIMDDDGHGLKAPPYSAPIVIEDRVWIGCNVTILKGVTIGEGSVVAAGALVTKSCPPGSLLAGVPAKVIREKIERTDIVRHKPVAIAH